MIPLLHAIYWTTTFLKIPYVTYLEKLSLLIIRYQVVIVNGTNVSRVKSEDFR